ncbi:hypothetical protein SISNIDRAFT_428820 [Sistotremastrum niveocremeum HHB9708]|uniref:Uncharacterized protein n=1 Tax=Sistotremastrum niveocremeum HHB9708 TaxID=1314777 RepID=A0A164U1F4_9AGAM|nr:hypothetical protein SISNIDRAFT_428820 [Sistotremastrum niveocremeum HHB9708]
MLSQKREPRYSHSRPVVCEAASDELRVLLNSEDWTSRLGELAKTVVESQVASYQKSVQENGQRFEEIDALFDAQKWKNATLGEDPIADVKRIEGITDPKVRKAVWDWEKIPYTTFCAGRYGTKPAKGAMKRDVDEWVLRNERWLRLPGHPTWQAGLLKISDFTTIFPDAKITPSAITITRPKKMEGFTILDLKRDSRVRLQSSVANFTTTFDRLTEGVLRGLNWDNVFVAGGMVLGTLLSPPTTGNPSNLDTHFLNSDIDVYIHGLGPAAATAKIKEIFETFKSNLTPHAPTLCVRNSKTITFFSRYPTKRIQIVLKLVKTPKEVLLNFDLDVCAAGYDGKEVYLLPRAARALETGYNLFTMDLIQGHYLGERRASQEDRVFKYANKGYGIRFLPSYVNARDSGKSDEPKNRSERKELYEMDLEAVSQRARGWVSRLIKKYIKWGHKKLPPKGTKFLPQSEIERLSYKNVPIFTHAMLESHAHLSSEPVGMRSCLSGFMLLMRHVALWEESVKGNIELQEDLWASQIYSEMTMGGYSYDDTPRYPWDAQFTIAGFKTHIDTYNRINAAKIRGTSELSGEEFEEDLKGKDKRMTYADSIDEILDKAHHPVIPLFLPESVVGYANQVVRDALRDAGITTPRKPLRELVTKAAKIEARRGDQSEYTTIAAWTIDDITMWQQIDRKIDETFEIFWAFHRALRFPDMTDSESVGAVKAHVSRKAIRSDRSDGEAEELESFVEWSNKVPLVVWSYYGVMGRGWTHETDSDMETDEDDEDSFNRDYSDDEDGYGGYGSESSGWTMRW